MFTCYVADVVTGYAFDKKYDFLGKENFRSPFTTSVRGYKEIVHPCSQFTWLPHVLSRLPNWLVEFLQPSMATVLEFQRVCVVIHLLGGYCTLNIS
jgi:hypothetical protein